MSGGVLGGYRPFTKSDLNAYLQRVASVAGSTSQEVVVNEIKLKSGPWRVILDPIGEDHKVGYMSDNKHIFATKTEFIDHFIKESSGSAASKIDAKESLGQAFDRYVNEAKEIKAELDAADESLTRDLIIVNNTGKASAKHRAPVRRPLALVALAAVLVNIVVPVKLSKIGKDFGTSEKQLQVNLPAEETSSVGEVFYPWASGSVTSNFNGNFTVQVLAELADTSAIGSGPIMFATSQAGGTAWQNHAMPDVGGAVADSGQLVLRGTKNLQSSSENVVKQDADCFVDLNGQGPVNLAQANSSVEASNLLTSGEVEAFVRNVTVQANNACDFELVAKVVDQNSGMTAGASTNVNAVEPSPTPSASATPSATSTNSPSSTATGSATGSSSPSATPSSSASSTATGTSDASPTPSSSGTASESPSFTPDYSSSATASQSITPSSSPSSSPSPTTSASGTTSASQTSSPQPGQPCEVSGANLGSGKPSLIISSGMPVPSCPISQGTYELVVSAADAFFYPSGGSTLVLGNFNNIADVWAAMKSVQVQSIPPFSGSLAISLNSAGKTYLTLSCPVVPSLENAKVDSASALSLLFGAQSNNAIQASSADAVVTA